MVWFDSIDYDLDLILIIRDDWLCSKFEGHEQRRKQRDNRLRSIVNGINRVWQYFVCICIYKLSSFHLLISNKDLFVPTSCFFSNVYALPLSLSSTFCFPNLFSFQNQFTIIQKYLLCMVESNTSR